MSTQAPYFHQYLDNLSGELKKRTLDARSAKLVFAAPSIVRGSYGFAERKSNGIFFTGAKLAARLARPLVGRISVQDVIVDPAMGAGDLFIAVAAYLPIEKTVRRTLESWSAMLSGIDKKGEFLTAARLRLCLLARIRCGGGGSMSANDALATFPGFEIADFFECSAKILNHSRPFILTNPPYHSVQRAVDTQRSSGFISTAALFLQRLCESAPLDAEIVGLFPEVLRCGTSYAKMRDFVQAHVDVIEEQSLGRFDRATDVDVFLAHYRKTAKKPFQKGAETVRASTLSDRFEVRVGSVVPHRTPFRGKWIRFASAKLVEPWNLAFEPGRSIRYGGTSYKPPFVVLRRTSSPKQRLRAVASVIIGSNPVAVENHLVVLRPFDGKLSTCRALVRHLRSRMINERLNTTMRCRHLTRESIASLPFMPT